MQTMVCLDLTPDKTKMNDEIKRRVDQGSTMLHSHGGVTDAFLMEGGHVDAIAQMVDLIRAQGVPAGVGSHSLDVTKACHKAGIVPDFYLKTLHMDRYWSATPEDRREEYDWLEMHSHDHDANNDNMWCNNPEETAEFMATVNVPWVAFKVMAAGALTPRMAFPYAYRNGADFICAGMFDFQVEPDVKIAIESLGKVKSRKRPWLG